jgi:AraC-like DNA-binding protein/quercetin dioxygenase-like cupin family protein
MAKLARLLGMRQHGSGVVGGEAIPPARQSMSRVRHTPADEPYFVARTLVATLRDGDTVPPHTHAWGQLIYVSSGVLTVQTAAGTWVAPPQWAVWAPRDMPHGFRASGAAALRTVYLRPGLRGLPRQGGIVAVSPLLREVIGDAVRIGMLDRRVATHAALVTLLREALRLVPAPAVDLPWPSSDALRAVADHVAAAPATRDHHAALAKRFGVSVRSLERGFARETGLSLGRWARQARFQFALRRMGSGAAVKTAAADAGYATPSAFVAAFRAAFGTTPGQYFGPRG